MRRLFDYIKIMWYIPHVMNALRKDENNVYYIDMKTWGDMGMTWLEDDRFKTVMLALRAITKQDTIKLIYGLPTSTGYNQEDLISVDDDTQTVIWDKERQEYIVQE